MASARKLILIARGACAMRIAIIGKSQIWSCPRTPDKERWHLRQWKWHSDSDIIYGQWGGLNLLNNLKTFLHSLHNWISGRGRLKTSVKAETEVALVLVVLLLLGGPKDFYKNLIWLKEKAPPLGPLLATRFFKLYSFSKLQCCHKRAAYRSSWKIARKI